MAITNEQPSQENFEPDQVELPAQAPIQETEDGEAQHSVSRLAAAAPHKPGPHHAKLSEDEKKALDIHNHGNIFLSLMMPRTWFSPLQPFQSYSCA